MHLFHIESNNVNQYRESQTGVWFLLKITALLINYLQLNDKLSKVAFPTNACGLHDTGYNVSLFCQLWLEPTMLKLINYVYDLWPLWTWWKCLNVVAWALEQSWTETKTAHHSLDCHCPLKLFSARNPAFIEILLDEVMHEFFSRLHNEESKTSCARNN